MGHPERQIIGENWSLNGPVYRRAPGMVFCPTWFPRWRDVSPNRPLSDVGIRVFTDIAAPCPEMLASMTETDPRADMPPVNWSELGVGELPTVNGDAAGSSVEGSTRLSETQPEEMTAAGRCARQPV